MCGVGIDKTKAIGLFVECGKQLVGRLCHCEARDKEHRGEQREPRGVVRPLPAGWFSQLLQLGSIKIAPEIKVCNGWEVLF